MPDKLTIEWVVSHSDVAEDDSTVIGALIEELEDGDGQFARNVWRYGLSVVKRDQRYRELRNLKIAKADPRKWKQLEELAAVQEHRFDEAQRASMAGMFGKIATALQEYECALYDKWMINGRHRLGDATRAVLLDAAAREQDTADGHLKNVAFYSELALRVPEGKSLRDSMSVYEADQIRARIYAGEQEMSEAA